MEAINSLRVTLVHDWLTGMRGGEKVLELFARRWPHAHLFTLLHQRGSVSPAIENLQPRTSVLQRLPGVSRYYRYLLPLMPWAIDKELPPSDLVLSSSHCVAKGVRVPKGATHVCYCFTPMRYAWHMRASYDWRGVKGWAVDRVLERMRAWDKRTASGVHHFIAISREVQRRIRECYGRDSVVIYPPVDTDFYTPVGAPRDDYYLVVSAFAPYKRIDLAVDACNRLGRRLVVIGTGQDEKRLRARAGLQATFLGWQSSEAIRDHLRRCRALLFPGVEDFGIVPVEAQACGTPVIAFGEGGAAETVAPLGQRGEPTGVWFEEQTADCLAEAITRLERNLSDFNPVSLRRQAERFTVARFQEELSDLLTDVMFHSDRRRVAA